MKNVLDEWQLKAVSEVTHTLLTHSLWPQILIVERDYYNAATRFNTSYLSWQNCHLMSQKMSSPSHLDDLPSLNI